MRSTSCVRVLVAVLERAGDRNDLALDEAADGVDNLLADVGGRTHGKAPSAVG